jgi:hypothetical protein
MDPKKKWSVVQHCFVGIYYRCQTQKQQQQLTYRRKINYHLHIQQNTIQILQITAIFIIFSSCFCKLADIVFTMKKAGSNKL